jgi:hypothetical protein
MASPGLCTITLYSLLGLCVSAARCDGGVRSSFFPYWKFMAVFTFHDFVMCWWSLCGFRYDGARGARYGILGAALLEHLSRVLCRRRWARWQDAWCTGGPTLVVHVAPPSAHHSCWYCWCVLSYCWFSTHVAMIHAVAFGSDRPTKMPPLQQRCCVLEKGPDLTFWHEVKHGRCQQAGSLETCIHVAA